MHSPCLNPFYSAGSSSLLRCSAGTYIPRLLHVRSTCRAGSERGAAPHLFAAAPLSLNRQGVISACKKSPHAGILLNNQKEIYGNGSANRRSLLFVFTAPCARQLMNKQLLSRIASSTSCLTQFDRLNRSSSVSGALETPQNVAVWLRAHNRQGCSRE